MFSSLLNQVKDVASSYLDVELISHWSNDFQAQGSQEKRVSDVFKKMQTAPSFWFRFLNFFGLANRLVTKGLKQAFNEKVGQLNFRLEDAGIKEVIDAVNSGNRNSILSAYLVLKVKGINFKQFQLAYPEKAKLMKTLEERSEILSKFLENGLDQSYNRLSLKNSGKELQNELNESDWDRQQLTLVNDAPIFIKNKFFGEAQRVLLEKSFTLEFVKEGIFSGRIDTKDQLFNQLTALKAHEKGIDEDLNKLLQVTLSQGARNEAIRQLAVAVGNITHTNEVTVGRTDNQKLAISVIDHSADKVSVVYSYNAPFVSANRSDPNTVGSCNLTFSYDIVKKNGEWTILDPVVQPIKVSP